MFYQNGALRGIFPCLRLITGKGDVLDVGKKNLFGSLGGVRGGSRTAPTAASAGSIMAREGNKRAPATPD